MYKKLRYDVRHRVTLQDVKAVSQWCVFLRMCAQYAWMNEFTLENSLYATLGCKTFRYYVRRYVTMWDVTLRSETLRCETLRYDVRRYVTMWDVTLRCDTLRYDVTRYVTMWDVTLRCKTLPYDVRRYVTTWDVTLRYETLREEIVSIVKM